MRTLYTTSRDLALLADLSTYRFLSSSQTARLHFPSIRAAEDRLRRLRASGLVTRVARSLSVREGRREMVHALTRRGSEVLALRTGRTAPPYLTRNRERSALFLEHTLHRNDLRIALEVLSRDSELQLGAWREAKAAIGFSALVSEGRRHMRVPVVPDGFFVTVRRGVCNAFYVEVDMGTVRLKRMLARYRAYWHHWKSRPQVVGAAPLRVLTVASSARRAETLRRLAIDAPEGRRGSHLFWFSSFEELDLEHDPHRLLAAHWRSATASEPESKPLFPQ